MYHFYLRSRLLSLKKFKYWRGAFKIEKSGRTISKSGEFISRDRWENSVKDILINTDKYIIGLGVVTKALYVRIEI